MSPPKTENRANEVTEGVSFLKPLNYRNESVILEWNMSDVHSKKIRSYNMSMIRAKDTKPEILVRKFLFAKGFRYRLHDRKLPGKPDIVLSKLGIVIFINGCFWHSHAKCKYFVVPKTKTDWWIAKLGQNKIRDKKNAVALSGLGWKLITVWECELKPHNIEATLSALLQHLKN